MRKTLATLATIAALSGCASEPVAVSPPLPSPASISLPAPQPSRNSVTDYISGTSTSAVTHAQAPYSLDTIILAGSREYIVQPNIHQKEGELEFRLTPYENATLLHDRKGRAVSIESPNTYVPAQVMIPAAKAGIDPATEASEIYFKPLGAYSSKTPSPKKRNPEEIETRTRSQDDSEFNIPTTTIQGKEFYVAVKRDDKGNVTNTYFVPVEGAVIGVRQRDRAITLRNPGKIYEIAEVTDYKTRTATPAKSTTPEVEAVK